MWTESPSCILLTGVTGFLGKVVLEELLRRRHECNFSKIFVLLRAAKGKTAHQRFLDEVASSKCFENLSPKWIEYVEVIEGDLSLPNCGIDDSLLPLICAESTHIMNCAACVSFDLPLIEATKANVSTARNLISLAKSCPRLRGMATTSTAYVAPHRSGLITPTPAPLPYSAELLYQRILAGKVDEKALLRETKHPNTYTLTKCLAEHMYLQHAPAIPGLTIVRPSIISCALRYPSPGWIDSKAAIAGFIALMGGGYLRVIDGNKAARLDVVPVDIVANDIIDAASLTPSPPPVYKEECEKSTGALYPIVHSVAGVRNSLSINSVAERSIQYFSKLHAQQNKKNPAIRDPKLSYLGGRNVNFHLHDLRDHRLPLAFGALCFQISGNKEMKRKTQSLARVLKKINHIFPYYTHHTFDFVPGRTWAQSIDEQVNSLDPNAEVYLGIILDGVRKNLLRM
ncbi:hypothetical protein H2200_013129 [Cladophialophora chaetospira]|uniref:Fatty acyl-CoA reductase n=1 Tax=Cladophialophora chaetospira TaxID=386627 RepID=A0AA38WW82_9EURO|nr:hypothetical protein H2200_013129 [Cladophialophora chaetospira]